MKLTLLLACLWLDYYFDTGARFRNQAWFDVYITRLKSLLGSHQTLWGGPLSLVIVLLPVFIVLAILWAIAGHFSGVVELAIGFVVLYFCFGPTALQEALVHYLKKDADVASAEQELKSAGGALINAQTFNRSVTELVFWQAHERFFGVIFWFLILGPVGALLYRMISWMQENAHRLQAEFYPQFSQHIDTVYWISAWIPSRLAALSYTLGGNFMPGFDVWKNGLVKTDRCKEELIDSGLAALTTEPAASATREENLKAHGIVLRALFIWVLVAAVATLGHAFL
ncbi:MAG: regulatory signaling modulator protein AmpE [Gammaproteobacteria bacterium]|jgi:membrane protein required for beta-lactamase induction